MPELPEVEVVKRSLEKNIINLIFKQVTINTKKLRYPIKKLIFDKVINKKITWIKRRSKYILICLENKLIILIHLGMTGKFLIEDKKNQKNRTSYYYSINHKDEKHNHIIFHLNKKKKLIYNDIRKFGFIKILPLRDIDKNPHLISLGPEPLEKFFNLNYFKKYIANKNKKLKDLMMDQKFVSGLGNIYVNEILFLCGIHPEKKLNSLTSKDMSKIIKFTKLILKKAIKDGGSSIKDFKNSEGQNGAFQQKFNVYGKVGRTCPRKNCNELIKKIEISKRSTFFCVRCQK